MTDLDAELAILGAALFDPRIIAATKLDPGQFAHPVHGSLWTALGKVAEAGQRPDAVTLAPHLPETHARHLQTLLPTLVGAGIASNADAYATTIRDRAERRRLAALVEGLQFRLESPQPVEDTLAWAEANLLPTTALDRTAETLWTVDEFLDRKLPEVDWVIPDVLAVGDRLILTGVEGFGKSVLMRQIGMCAAAGVHPFTLQRVPAKRVLVVDCENPERIMMRKLDDLRRVIRARQATPEHMWIKRYPQGLDLADPKDRLQLHHLLQLARPDVLLIGPAYKLYVGGANQREEDLARQVTKVLDGLREEFGFALVLEHHSPHGNGEGQRSVRPIGSSLWMRWPEFGLGIRPRQGTKVSDRRGELIPWRGSRDEREWPRELDGGLPGELPWINPQALASTTYTHGGAA